MFYDNENTAIYKCDNAASLQKVYKNTRPYGTTDIKQIGHYCKICLPCHTYEGHVGVITAVRPGECRVSVISEGRHIQLWLKHSDLARTLQVHEGGAA